MGGKGLVSSTQVMSYFPFGVLLHGIDLPRDLTYLVQELTRTRLGLGNHSYAEKFVLKNRSSALGVWAQSWASHCCLLCLSLLVCKTQKAPGSSVSSL